MILYVPNYPQIYQYYIIFTYCCSCVLQGSFNDVIGIFGQYLDKNMLAYSEEDKRQSPPFELELSHFKINAHELKPVPDLIYKLWAQKVKGQTS